MNQITDKQFWIFWITGAVMAVIVCLSSSLNEDTLLLAVAFAMSLIAIAIIHHFRNHTALCNIIFWFGYNSLLSYGLLFKSEGGAGLTWWFYLLSFNCLQFIILTIYSVFSIYAKKKQ